MPTVPFQDRWRDHPVFGFVDWILRGIGQVVFQNNPRSGAIILAGIFYNSWIYGTICLFATIVSTLTAILFKADKGMIKDGLFGFNGALIGIAFVAYTSPNFTTGNVPNAYLIFYIMLCAVFTTIILPAFGALLGPHRVPGLTMPFVLATWFFLGALLQFTTIDVSNALKPTSPADFSGPRPDYTWITWFHGITMGIAEIFFQDNWVTGIVILTGIAVNTRIGALMALMGSTLAVGVAVLYGAHDEAIRDGLFGYNAALTAMALGGMFLVFNLPAFLYAFIGALVTARVWASLGIFLEPAGMPVLTSAFVFVTWLMLLAKDGFSSLIPVAPADATTPEDNLRRFGKSS
ncbi:urea transporter [Nitrospira sp. KM1]|uniref:urea transporter n=1 Tax=Nitrospira sp. KM1 TaxID=1936990 RepID=UPI0013A729AB|nr:urea transporter [Nitrospira sp. KM1]BCA56778.1 urea transporter [Nitrospira sp. KM1]